MLKQDPTNIFERVTSAFPLSVGTSLALEGFFQGGQTSLNEDYKGPMKDISRYDTIRINVSTLIRNAFNAVPTKVKLGTNHKELLEVLLSEIGIIEDIFNTNKGGICRPLFYTCSYKRLFNKYNKKVKFRTANTELQLHLELTSRKVIEELHKRSNSVENFDSDIRVLADSNILMFTHVPYDLVDYKKYYGVFELLESHTGEVKPYTEWNTKYAKFGENSMTHLPFFKELLFVFGDRSQIKPHEYKLRQLIYDISIQRKWTPQTTRGKIRQDLSSDVAEPFVRQFLLNL